MPLVYPFTPDVIDRSRCVARTWNSGRGGQCRLAPDGGAGLCPAHSKQATETGLGHGRVDGPVPLPKLLEFQKVSGVEVDSKIVDSAPKAPRIEVSLGIAQSAAAVYSDPSRFPQPEKRSAASDKLEEDLLSSLSSLSAALWTKRTPLEAVATNLPSAQKSECTSATARVSPAETSPRRAAVKRSSDAACEQQSSRPADRSSKPDEINVPEANDHDILAGIGLGKQPRRSAREPASTTGLKRYPKKEKKVGSQAAGK